ncbi:MAG: hypothetical protein II014_02870 [Bifidobacteriaceae bacterium]|nr:hypothetical protein [Bifidobacteriaceae bacterium]
MKAVEFIQRQKADVRERGPFYTLPAFHGSQSITSVVLSDLFTLLKFF